jgi:DNA polymerase V
VQEYGKGTLHVAATAQSNSLKEWGMRQERRTPCYTAKLSDIPVARA